MDMFYYSFQIFKKVDNLENAIENEQNKAYRNIKDNFKADTWYIIIVGALAIWSLLSAIFDKGERSWLTELLLEQTGIIGILIVFIFYCVLYGLLGYPLLRLADFLNKLSAESAYEKARTNDVVNGYQQKIRALLNNPRFLKYKKIIPATYFNMNDLYLLYCYLEEHRADNFKEAVNLLIEEKHIKQVKCNQEVMLRTLENIKKNSSDQLDAQINNLQETRRLNEKVSNKKVIVLKK